MPFYRYYCEKCKKEFEFFMKMGEKAPDCPDCGGELVKQLPRIQIKGSSNSCSSGSCSGCSGCSTHA
ncbi:FmdB family zinc ribbon protein [Pseudothermotoga lettingae]|uniref:FmdB family zinc ribbon protein n=1 Tax=Pseudothermotoga lettingae TaxID=177758 RepID=UPI000307EDAF